MCFHDNWNVFLPKSYYIKSNYNIEIHRLGPNEMFDFQKSIRIFFMDQSKIIHTTLCTTDMHYLSNDGLNI